MCTWRGLGDGTHCTVIRWKNSTWNLRGNEKKRIVRRGVVRRERGGDFLHILSKKLALKYVKMWRITLELGYRVKL